MDKSHLFKINRIDKKVIFKIKINILQVTQPHKKIVQKIKI